MGDLKKNPIVSCLYQIKPGLELKHMTWLEDIAHVLVYCAALLKGCDTGGHHSNFSKVQSVFSLRACHLKETALTHYTDSLS